MIPVYVLGGIVVPVGSTVVIFVYSLWLVGTIFRVIDWLGILAWTLMQWVVFLPRSRNVYTE